jgi:beta-glucanase (GH16 family)
MPAPQCQSETYTFENISKSLAEYTTYLGDSKDTAWTYSGSPLQYGDNLLLTMPANSAGSVLMSTKYVWYGKVSATVKTARDQGVITAFIFLSDVKDEIDYEFVGKDLYTAQTNIYWEALPYYGNSGNISNITDTYDDWHTYTVDWSPDQIQWSVDGVVGRTKTRASTWNSTSGLYNYPQTPARVQLSVWPGGASSQAPGTIAWAGGPIDWSSPDIQQSGYYYMQVSKVEIDCYNPPSGAAGSGSVSYIYNSDTTSFLNTSVELSDKGTTLKSQLGTGTNTTAAPSGTASATAVSNPNVGNAGGGSADGNRGGSGGSGSSGSASTTGDSGTSFSQGGGSSSSEASNFRGYSRIVASWSAVMGLVVGGIFVLL